MIIFQSGCFLCISNLSTTANTPAFAVTLRQLVCLFGEVGIDPPRLWLWAGLVITLVWSHWNTAWSQNKEHLHLHWCSIQLSTFSSSVLKFSFEFIQNRGTLSLGTLTGNHTKCQHFLVSRCFYPLSPAVITVAPTHTHTHQKAEVWSVSLTRPAIGVESLFTRLMMPGFSWLIRLHRKNKQ